MKTRPLFILAALLVVLVALRFWQRSSHDTRLAETGFEQLFPALSPDEIGGLTVAGPGGGEVVLARDGADWKVETSYGHPADASKLERLLGELSGLQGEYRSDREAVLADYALDDARAIHLRVRDLAGAELGHLLLGDRMTGSAGFFARRAGEEKAYAARGNLLGSLGVWGENREIKAKTFLDLKAFEVDRAQVDAIRIVDGARSLELKKTFAPPPADTVAVDRSQYGWSAGGRELDKAKVDGVLGALASIFARDLLDPAAELGFAAAGRRAELVLVDGDVRAVAFGETVNEPEAGVAMRVVGEDAAYLVYDRLPDRIFKTRDELLPDAK